VNLETFRTYCLSKKGATEDLPFDEDTLVFKVAGKIFAITDLTNFTSINLKTDPEKGVELREKYEAVTPGYHMNKKHWNTVQMDGSVPLRELKQWIDESYDLVVAGLTKKQKSALETS
jgi:predicted DNA-binding protein (MmcQ/YjbR family)